MRGTLFVGAAVAFHLGIIPALAGNTRRRASPRPRTGDHPRACGEHAAVKVNTYAGLGSSPRLRGTRYWSVPWRNGRGIIPALAGNTFHRGHTQVCPRDHPRACGEHIARISFLFMVLGSSPRLRGTPVRRCRRSASSRIIPALAGNTNTGASCRRRTRDHPRAVLLQCLFSRLISIFPQCGRMVFPGLVIMQSVM